MGEQLSVVAGYLSEHRISYPVYLDPYFRLVEALGEKGPPTVLVVDRAGRVTRLSSALGQGTLDERKDLLAAAPGD